MNSVENFTKPEKNNKYFWVFEFMHKNNRKQQTKQNLFDFLNTKRKIEEKANQN
jgi:hypothetical protein